MEIKLGTHVYYIISMTEIYVVVYKNKWRQVNYKSCEFAYRDGIKRKGDKIGMGEALLNRFEHTETPTTSHNPYIVA